MSERRSVPASSTAMVFHRIAFPNALNDNGIVFGGTILAMYDECSGLIGSRFLKGNVTTVSVDHVAFTRPIRSGETMVISGRVVHTGRTSFTVKMQMDIERRGVYLGHAGSAVFTYVALDEAFKPTQAPELLLETEEDHQLWNEAEEFIRRMRG